MAYAWRPAVYRASAFGRITSARNNLFLKGCIGPCFKLFVRLMVFTYCENDFVFETFWNDSDKKTSFDIALQSKWLSAVDKGIFRYRLNILDAKRLPGKYFFLAQLNPDRAVNRRPPQSISSLTLPFNPDKFNFTKINEKEILFEVKSLEAKDTSSRDILVVNISPLEFGHSLFLPEVNNCYPQISTFHGLKQTLELVLLSGSPSLRAGFNSLCAFATVNHLHYHLYYLHHHMLLEDIAVEHLSGVCYVLISYPAKGFVFQLDESHDITQLASSIHKLTNYFQTRNIAHNLYITRGTSFERAGKRNSSLNTLRVYVWARKHSTGPKNVEAFDPAICELFGHVIVKVPEPFTSLTEAVVADELCNICQEPFDEVQDDVRALFQEGKAD